MPDVLVPPPATGRLVTRRRRVRLGDVSPAGRLRLDALARYLQDVSDDDTRDAPTAAGIGWVVRSLLLEVPRFPILGEELTLTTFCSGTGPRWAERRVSVEGEQGGRAEAATLWVHVDRDGRPTGLPAGFLDVYGPAAAGRVVRARLVHPDPPAGSAGSPWPLRFTDFDVLGHVNNAAAWAVVEEALATRRDLRAPLRAEMEFRGPIEPGAHLEQRFVDGEDGGMNLWLTDGDTVLASVAVRRLA